MVNPNAPFFSRGPWETFEPGDTSRLDSDLLVKRLRRSDRRKWDMIGTGGDTELDRYDSEFSLESREDEAAQRHVEGCSTS